MRKCAILAALLLTGCASSETVLMRNPGGQEITCGPYEAFGNIPSARRDTFAQLRACVDDFEKQGYVRVAK